MLTLYIYIYIYIYIYTVDYRGTNVVASDSVCGLDRNI